MAASGAESGMIPQISARAGTSVNIPSYAVIGVGHAQLAKRS
jgi:hypothetical protein